MIVFLKEGSKICLKKIESKKFCVKKIVGPNNTFLGLEKIYVKKDWTKDWAKNVLGPKIFRIQVDEDMLF